MSFLDPQTITVNAVAKVMPRIQVIGPSAIYQNSDESFKLTISHQKPSLRIRSMARIDQRVVAADPLTSVNDWQSLGMYLVIDRPTVGFSLVQVTQQWAGFKTWLDDPAIARLYGQES